MNTIHHGILVLAALLTTACTVPNRPGAASAPYGELRPEVARGYAAYGERLSAWGTWSPDSRHGVRWCPRADVAGDAFQPYLSRGHWEVPEGSSKGTPRWESEDPDTWGEITTHHGWWTHASGSWCWVPGTSATEARVLWRSGDGYAGWTPEPPAWEELDDLDFDRLPWVYTLLGTLAEVALDLNALSGDAAEEARHATAASVPSGGSLRPRRGPSGASVGAARLSLLQYGHANLGALASAIDKLPAGVKIGWNTATAAGLGGSSVKSGASSGSSSSSSSSSSSHKGGWRLEIISLPPALAFYDALLVAPPAGPIGLVPRPSTGWTATGGSTGAGTGGGLGTATAALSTVSTGGMARGAHGVFGHSASAALLAGIGPYGSTHEPSSVQSGHGAGIYTSTGMYGSHGSSSSGGSHGSHGSHGSSGWSHSSGHVSVGGGSFRIHR